MIDAVAALFFCTVTDDAGNTLHLNKPARHIVSLAPDLTESLFAAGAGQYVVGTIRGTDYPRAAKRISQVGSYAGIDIEKTLSLHPDLVVTWGNNFSRQTAVLSKLGVPVYVSHPQQLEDIPRTLQNLGCLAGTLKTANKAAETFSQRLAYLKGQHRTRQPVRVFFQVGAYSLLTVNKTSWINQVIELCGGKNIFADVKTMTQEVTWESVLVANPDVVMSDATNVNWKIRWQRWPMLSAVKNKKLFSIPPDLIDRAGPRLLDGAAKVCRLVSPNIEL